MNQLFFRDTRWLWKDWKYGGTYSCCASIGNSTTTVNSTKKSMSVLFSVWGVDQPLFVIVAASSRKSSMGWDWVEIMRKYGLMWITLSPGAWTLMAPEIKASSWESLFQMRKKSLFLLCSGDVSESLPSTGRWKMKSQLCISEQLLKTCSAQQQKHKTVPPPLSSEHQKILLLFSGWSTWEEEGEKEEKQRRK